MVANDFAPINQGQLKWLATQAAVEFTADGLISSDITALVNSFSPTNNYLPVNLGAISLRLGGKRLVWDSQAMNLVNRPGDNKYLSRDYRAGWDLKPA